MEKESSEEKKETQGQGSSSGSYSQTSNEGDANILLSSLEYKLNTTKEWKQVESVFELGKYYQFIESKPSYELCMSFAVQATKAKIDNKHFIPALAFAIKWLL